MKMMLIAIVSLGLTASLQAGSIFLTGHDIDFHSNQAGYSTVILNWLRGAGTGSEIAAASYRVGALRTTGTGTFNSPPGGFPVDIRDPLSFVDSAAFATWLGTIDALEIASHTTCGGCALATAGSDRINTYAPQIASFFNAGGDIWGNSGAQLGTYYNFLPAGAVATGASISGSSGFAPTAAGAAIGITNAMVNGFPTHNRFSSFAAAFTVFEVRTISGGEEVISIGARDARIGDDGIDVVPEPATFALVGLMLGSLVMLRRNRAQK